MAVKFTIANRISTLSGDVPHELLDKAMSFRVQGYQYTSAFKSKRWDGRKHLYRPFTGKLPTGLVSEAVALLRKEGIACELDDARVRPHVWNIPINLKGIDLRPYQLEAAEAAYHCERGVLCMATNSGKTEVAAAVIQRLGLPALFLNHTRALMYQSRGRLAERLDVKVGVVGDGKWEPEDVTVCCVKTLFSRIRTPECAALIARYPVVFSDECHRVGNNHWYEVLMKSDAYFRYGLSGTAYMRGDGASLMLRAAAGGSIYEVSNKDLVDGGYSAEATVTLFKMHAPEDLPFEGIHWREVYERGIVKNAKRNTLITNIAATPARYGLQRGPVLVIVKEIDHGFRLLQRMQREGLQADFVYGEEDADVQLAKLDRFRSGALRVLVASTIVDEGLDIPAIKVGVNAAGGKSSIRTLQRIGRGLRKDKALGKLRLDWVDFIDFPNVYLLKHSKQRMHDYEGEGAFGLRVVEG